MSLMFYSVVNEGRANATRPLNPKSIKMRFLETDGTGPTTIDVPMTVRQAMSAITQLAEAVDHTLQRADIHRALGNTDPTKLELHR